MFVSTKLPVGVAPVFNLNCTVAYLNRPFMCLPASPTLPSDDVEMSVTCPVDAPLLFVFPAGKRGPYVTLRYSTWVALNLTWRVKAPTFGRFPL